MPISPLDTRRFIDAGQQCERLQPIWKPSLLREKCQLHSPSEGTFNSQNVGLNSLV